MSALPKKDPWLGTVRLLSASVAMPRDSDRPPLRRQSLPAGNRRASTGSCGACAAARGHRVAESTVCVLERPTRTTAFIYWSDSSLGHYGHQPWRAAIASTDGYCALSGQRIHRGDAVFRPSKARLSSRFAGGTVPANAAAMILSTSMPDSDDPGADH